MSREDFRETSGPTALTDDVDTVGDATHTSDAITSATSNCDAVSGATSCVNNEDESDVDAVTAATSLATAAAALDPGDGHAGTPPPSPAPPGSAPASASDDGIDAATGATPGVASACRELDMTSPDEVSRRLGIKPPGQA